MEKIKRLTPPNAAEDVAQLSYTASGNGTLM